MDSAWSRKDSFFHNLLFQRKLSYLYLLMVEITHKDIFDKAWLA